MIAPRENESGIFLGHNWPKFDLNPFFLFFQFFGDCELCRFVSCRFDVDKINLD